MPKTTKNKIKASNPRAGPSKSISKAPVGGGGTAPNFYSSFLPIRLSIASAVPIPSSSSKPITAVIHHVYARLHTSRSKGGDDDLPGDRTVFVANLPVDMGERGLRAVFGKWGVVERVIMGGKGEGDVLERAVRGMEAEEEDEDDEDSEDEDGTGKEKTTGAEDGDAEETERSGLKFMGDPTLSSRKRRRLNKLPKSVPDVISLSPLNPRTDAYGLSGSATAHVVYLEAVCVSRVMAHSGPAIPFLPAAYPENPSGLSYYLARHSSLRPSLSSVKAYSDTSMARFDHLHSLLLSSRAKQAGAGALVDEDGFTMVVRSGNHSRTGGIADRMGRNLGSVGIAGKGFGKAGFSGKTGKKGGIGSGELSDFYKFQKMDKKRQELVDLRSKFEEDKKKVEEMKRAKRFKPY